MTMAEDYVAQQKAIKQSTPIVQQPSMAETTWAELKDVFTGGTRGFGNQVQQVSENGKRLFYELAADKKGRVALLNTMVSTPLGQLMLYQSARDAMFSPTKAKSLAEQSAERVKALKKEAPIPEGSGIGYAIGSGIPTVATSVGLGLLSGGATLPATVFGAYAGVGTAGEALDKGASPVKATTLGIISGLGEGYLEKVGLGWILKPGTTKPLAKWAIRSASEAFQEISQTSKDNLIAKFGYDGARELTQGVLTSGIAGFVLGGATNVGLSIFEKSELQQQGVDEKTIAELDEVVKTKGSGMADAIIKRQKPAEVDYTKMTDAEALDAERLWSQVVTNKVAKAWQLVDKPDSQLNLADKAAIAKQKYTLGIANLRTISNVVFGGDESLYQNIRDSYVKESQTKSQLSNYYLKRMAVLFPQGGYKPVSGDPLGLNSYQRVELAYRLGNAGDRQMIAQNGIKAKGDAEYYLNTPFLTDQEQIAVTLMKDLVGNVSPEYSRILTKLSGRDIVKEDNWLPRRYQKYTGVPNSTEEQLMDNLSGVLAGQKDKLTLDTHSAKERTRNTGRFQLDALNRMRYVINTYSKLSAFGDKMPSIVKITKTVLPAVKEQFGENVASTLQDRIQSAVLGPTKSPKSMQWIERGARTLTNIGYTQALAFRPIKMSFTQLGSLINTIGEIGFNETIDGLKSTFTPEYQEAIANDPELRDRMADVTLDDVMSTLKSEEMTQLKKNTIGLLQKLRDNVIFKGMTWTDARTAGAAYMGAKHKWLRLHPGDTEEAIQAARDALENTQAMTQQIFRSGIQSSDLGKMLTAFQTQQMAVANLLIRESNMAKLSANNRQLYKKIIVAGIIPALYQGLLDYTWKQMSGTLKKGDEWRVSFQNAVGMLPAIGGVIRNVESGRGQMSFIFTKPIADTYKDLQTIGGKKDLTKKVWAAMRIEMRLNNIPTNALDSTIDWIAKEL